MAPPTRMKLGDFAKTQGLSYIGAYKLWLAGAIDGIQLPSDTILVTGWKNEPEKADQGNEENTEGMGNKVIIYARVSSNQNKDNLDAQALRLTQYATANGYQVVRVIKETGSGLNDQRKKLLSLLEQDQSKWDILLVEHKDRLTRFGFSYLEMLVKRNNQSILVVNQSDTSTRSALNSSSDDEDLMQDFVSIVTSFCARLYGLRRSRRHTEELIKLAKDNTKSKEVPKELGEDISATKDDLDPRVGATVGSGPTSNYKDKHKGTKEARDVS